MVVLGTAASWQISTLTKLFQGFTWEEVIGEYDLPIHHTGRSEWNRNPSELCRRLTLCNSMRTILIPRGTLTQRTPLCTCVHCSSTDEELCLESCFFGWAVHPEYTPSIPQPDCAQYKHSSTPSLPAAAPLRSRAMLAQGLLKPTPSGGGFQITSEGQWHHQNSFYKKEMKVIIKILLTKSSKSSFQQHITLLMYQTMKASNSPKQNSNLQSKAYEITEHNGRIRWEHISLPSAC